MNKPLYFIINVLIYWVVITGINAVSPGSFGLIFSLLIGGALFSVLSLLVEPLLGFFKFPLNFWGLLVVGFLVNLLFFIILSTGVLPPIIRFNPGSFGAELAPFNFFNIPLANGFIIALFVSVVATLFQILIRRVSD